MRASRLTSGMISEKSCLPVHSGSGFKMAGCKHECVVSKQRKRRAAYLWHSAVKVLQPHQHIEHEIARQKRIAGERGKTNSE